MTDIHDLFLEIDSDKSGSIDAAELRKGLALIGMHFSSKRYKRLFRAVDKNRDGTIDFSEFFRLIYPDEAMPDSLHQKDLEHKSYKNLLK
jgi:Ca2+-binding EF-hand superfamily protein